MRVVRMNVRPLEEGPESWLAGKYYTASQGEPPYCRCIGRLRNWDCSRCGQPNLEDTFSGGEDASGLNTTSSSGKS